ncbi:MAG TPA: DEAD/DEAH box helicase [Xanthobacteraceae bacterium]|nr:DEAD/DEAH box helicase [Xanthobacteraceae bacterium]
MILTQTEDAAALDDGLAGRLRDAFERGSGHGLLCLGGEQVGTTLPPALSYWRDLGTRYVTALCALPGLGESGTKPAVPTPPAGDLEMLAAKAPPMLGAEYLTADILAQLWSQTDAAFDVELTEVKLPVQQFLKTRHPAWNLVGRVHFNLAENRKDEDAPFAFLATYTTRLSAAGKAQHLPLGKALQEYSGAKNRDRLLSLLMPVQRAAGQCTWLKAMVDGGEIYHPLRWTAPQALQLLKDVAILEAAGVIVRMPPSWRMNRPARPVVTAKVGSKAPSKLGLDALLDFRLEVTLDGDDLTKAEIKRLLAQTSGLAFIRGKWVEIDRERLAHTLAQFEAVERRAASEGLSFGEAMRMLAGAGIAEGKADAQGDPDWSRTVAGPWLVETLAALHQPEGRRDVDPGASLQGTLRPYQRAGLQWLYLLARLRLGACLADDMGLGKTIQVLSLLLVLKQEAAEAHKPSLLIAPASLLANWAAEIARFAPSLRTVVLHPSVMPLEEIKSVDAKDMTEIDLAITSYGYLARAPVLRERQWRLVVLDEAQAIKNPAARQTRTVKELRADQRIALTGTPIENRLGDLWSIFDFINPGLLGSAKQFSAFTKSLGDGAGSSYGALRDLLRPYILRRLKTDKSIIADLPDKAEVKTFCSLSRKQAALYQEAVQELAAALDDAEGMQRKGIVLAFLMRLKQICNHPSQWLGDDAWGEEDSGKFARLREIAEVVASRQEKALIFTQFRETTAPLAHFLGSVFGRGGLVLHGETAVKTRQELVRRFQDDERIPFFVLSLKAGGSGLNLTAASHVIHFDRWWNPAVENQATDRAFRIGQTKNVLVHKFICRGTVEDKIDQLIESKARLAGDILGGGADIMLTEMKDDELMKLVTLDLNAAMKED